MVSWPVMWSAHLTLPTIDSVVAYIRSGLDITLLAAVPAFIGYRLNRRKDPRAWLFMTTANGLLAVFGLLSGHWGMLISGVFAYQSARNYWAWRSEERQARRVAPRTA